jgi:hypothetical protein
MDVLKAVRCLTPQRTCKMRGKYGLKLWDHTIIASSSHSTRFLIIAPIRQAESVLILIRQYNCPIHPRCSLQSLMKLSMHRIHTLHVMDRSGALVILHYDGQTSTTHKPALGKYTIPLLVPREPSGNPCCFPTHPDSQLLDGPRTVEFRTESSTIRGRLASSAETTTT